MTARVLVLAGILPALFSTATGQERTWIFFRDKGPPREVRSSPYTVPASAHISAAAFRRRGRTLSPDSLVRFEDRPLYEPYVDAIGRAGARVVVRSRWMNALSAVLPARAADIIRSLPFVERIKKVYGIPAGNQPADRHPPVTVLPAVSGAGGPDFEYGLSYAQLAAIGVPALHEIGVTGKDVVVGFLDSGFRWRSHESLEGITVLGEYDFVNGDAVSANQEGDPAGQDFHGTVVLSVAAGYDPGKLIGAAFGSSYLLAKTEVVPTETQIEEDYWVAGIEWLEAMGADIVNTSVGYDVWDNGSGYSWGNGDFDGRTSIVARAAAQAARLGVVVCVAMGNEGNGDGITGTMLTPADVDTALSVGALNTDGSLSGSSSTGPTSDGRTKPDLCAPGVSVYGASTSGYGSFTAQDGTSMATPLAAGAAALLLSVRPELTPVEVRDILRASADTARIRGYSSFPNNYTGWGYLDAFAAVLSVGPFFSNRPVVDTALSLTHVSVNVVSKYGIVRDSVILRHGREGSTESLPLRMTLDSAFLFPGSGRYRAEIPPYPSGTRIAFTIAAADSGGRRYTTPSPAMRDAWVLRYGTSGLSDPLPRALRLLQNYPNPFNGETNILLDLPADGRVTVTLYDMLGRLVRTVFDGDMTGGPASSRAPLRVRADGLPSGAYICRLTGPGGRDMKKMIILR